MRQSQAPISVCMFDNEIVRGGAEEHMLCLLRGLDRSRFRPMLVCPDELLTLLSDDLPRDVEVLPLSLHSYGQLSRMQALRHFLQLARVQVLHSHGFRPSLIASPVGRGAGIPVTVETPHVREYWRKGWKANFAIDRVASRFVDQYIAVSEANYKYLVEDKRLDTMKVTVIRNGCDIRRFDPMRVSPVGYRTSFGLQEDVPVLLVAGRLEAQKGHSVLIKAIALLQPQFPGLSLVALGEGSLRAELEAQVSELGLQDYVRMLGQVADIRDWMAAADICVLPSFAEGLPLFAIECLAAGRPMVASAVDGTPEIVVDGRTGLTVAPGDPAALAQAITRLLNDQQLASELGTAGAQWVREHFTLDRQIHETEELYNRLWCAKTGKCCPAESTPASLVCRD
jgi:glycosyltransferase involved in cell wall biosynthesis